MKKRIFNITYIILIIISVLFSFIFITVSAIKNVEEIAETLFNETFSTNIQEDLPILTSELPTNGTTGTELYTILSITVNDPNGLNFNISWGTNISGNWTETYQNLTCINGTYTQTTTWTNTPTTKYWWFVNVTNTNGDYTNKTYNFTTDEYHWGNWSDWWQFNFTNDCPTNFTATAYNKTQINLTWTNGLVGADTTIIIRNESNWTGIPTSPKNGTEIYNSTGTTYNDIGLNNGTQYCYSAWSWNETEGNFSLIYESDCDSTMSDIDISSPYPTNNSNEVTRPPANYSVQINGTNLNIYFYFYNMTPINDTWTLHYIFLDQSTKRFEITNLDTTQFIWGNTTYIWSVNVTNGSIWINKTYYYTTIALVNGKNARYDVNNDNTINIIDLSSDWTHRTISGYATYNELFDVDMNNAVNVIDLSLIWTNKT